jgi:alanine dehydrogenase
LPYGLLLADLGLTEAVAEDPELALGVNVLEGRVTHPGVAEAFDMEYTPLADIVYASAAA